MRNLLKRAIAFMLAVTMIAGIMPGNVQVFAARRTGSGTNKAITAIIGDDSESSGTDAAFVNEKKTIYAITPYTLGEVGNAENVLNKYILGQDGTTVYKKTDLIYRDNVEFEGNWGFSAKDAEPDEETGLYYGAFFESKIDGYEANGYIPVMGDSLEKNKETPLGEIKMTFAGYDGKTYQNIPLMDTLYPEYKYSYTQDQQYWAQVVSGIYNIQPLQPYSLLFAGSDVLSDTVIDKLNAAYIWYPNRTTGDDGMEGEATDKGFTSLTNNVIFGQVYQYANQNLKGTAGLADSTKTDAIATKYANKVYFNEVPRSENATWSIQFMKDEIDIEEDGGVFYEWLCEQGIWTNNKDGESFSIDEIQIDNYYPVYKEEDGEKVHTGEFELDNTREDEEPAFKKVSVGPQVDFDVLATIPEKLNTLLASKSDEAKNMTAEALTLWQYILYHTYYYDGNTVGAGDPDSSIQDKIYDFMYMGCEKTLLDYEGDRFDESDDETQYVYFDDKENVYKFKLPIVDYKTDELELTQSVKENDGRLDYIFDIEFNGADDYFDLAANNKFSFLSNMYNVHYLDLIICAYVCAYNRDPNSIATKEWGEMLEKYCNPTGTYFDENGVEKGNNWSAADCAIQVTSIAIASGDIKSNENSEKYKGEYINSPYIFAAAQDYAMLVYRVEEVGDVNSDSLLSLNKAFFGYDSGFMLDDESSVLGINPATTLTSVDIYETLQEDIVTYRKYDNPKYKLRSEAGQSIYDNYYNRLKTCLENMLASGKDVKDYNTSHPYTVFGGSGTITRVYQYMYTVANEDDTKSIFERLSINDWAKYGGIVDLLAFGLEDTSQPGVTSPYTREPVSDINPAYTVGSNMIVAYQWEDYYHVQARQDAVDVNFTTEQGDAKEWLIDLSEKEEEKTEEDTDAGTDTETGEETAEEVTEEVAEKKHEVTYEDGKTVLTFKTSTAPLSSLLQKVTIEELEEAVLTLGSKAHAIRKRYGNDSVLRARFVKRPIDHMSGGISREKRTVDYTKLVIE